MKYQSFIGLEVHIHLATKTKAFCSCKAAFGDEPNSNVCPVCMGYPGVLPALNAEAMRMGAVVAKALNCSIPERTWFERKQYFYPDMPKNYQISQFASPLGQNGWIDVPVPMSKDGSDVKGDLAGFGVRAVKRIRIKECHLEEDAGKMIHTGNASLIDYNRAGYSLLEIVTEPDFETGTEAEAYLHLLRRTVRYLGVCDGNMEEGSMRCDANVSINLPGRGLGSKVEVKNLNSSRFVRLSLDHEIARQATALDKGGTIRQETRLWNENRDQTEIMRTKESSHDYRFFPEPDLPPFIPDREFLNLVEAGLVELPFARERRFVEEYGLGTEPAALTCEEKAAADWFEAAVAEAVRQGVPKIEAAERVATWLSSDVRKVMNREGLGLSDIDSLAVSSSKLASIVAMTAAGKISGKVARQVFELILAEGGEPAEIVASKGWEMISDPAAISKAVDSAMKSEAATTEEAISAAARGDGARLKQLAGFLAGKAIAASGGKAEPSLIRAEIDFRLAGKADTLRP